MPSSARICFLAAMIGLFGAMPTQVMAQDQVLHLAQATDASKWTKPNIGFAKPPSAHADTAGEAQTVPSAGIQGHIDGSQVVGTVPQAANALNAQQAQTAASAQALDPNANIDINKYVPDCTGGKVLTKKPGSGLDCVLAASGAKGFANKLYFNTNNQTWTVPEEVFEVRLTAAAGSTVQWRQNYGVTGYVPAYDYNNNFYCWGDDSGVGCACHNGYVMGNYGSYSCRSPNPTGSSPTYGCLTPSQFSAPGQSGSRTFTVTPGQQFRALLSSSQVPAAVSAPHNQCPSNYDIVYSVIADVPPDAIIPDVYWDKRNSENAGEQSVSSAMIVEW